MRFQCSGSFKQGVSDVDPVATPLTILSEHIFNPNPQVSTQKFLDRALPTALFLALMGESSETVTLTLYLLIESLRVRASLDEYISADTRWLQFATGQVVTNGTLYKLTTGLPAGGIFYARMTADTIDTGKTRKLLAAWV